MVIQANFCVKGIADCFEGGISYFSAWKGFACDNVVNYEVVIASGETVNVNAKENADLWLALKGGSNNFGIVTRFDLKAFPQGDLWEGVQFFKMILHYLSYSKHFPISTRPPVLMSMRHSY